MKGCLEGVRVGLSARFAALGLVAMVDSTDEDAGDQMQPTEAGTE